MTSREALLQGDGSGGSVLIDRGGVTWPVADVDQLRGD
jgi:hypothetical protein